MQVSGQLQSHRIQPLPLLQKLLHHAPIVQVLIIHVPRIDIRISRDTDDGLLFNLICRIQLRYKVENQLLGEHVIPLSPRNLDQAFKNRIPAGNNPHSLLPALRLQVRHGIELPVL